MTDSFGFPTILQSKCILCVKKYVLGCTVKIYWTGGSMRFYLGLSADPNTSPTDWEEVTGLTSGVEKQYTMTSRRNVALWYKIVKDEDTIISTQFNIYGQRTAPAIEIKNFVISSLGPFILNIPGQVSGDV